MKKVLSIAMALLLCVGIVGCGNNGEDGKSKNETMNEVKINVDGTLELEYLSEEETLQLQPGQELKKLPDRRILESMGMDYEFEIDVIRTDVDNEDNVIETNLYLYDAPLLQDSTVEIDGTTYDETMEFECVRVGKLSDIYNVDGVWYKDISMGNGSVLSKEVLDVNNVDKIRKTLNHANF